MTIDEKIRDEKLQYTINREAGKNRHYHQVKMINMKSKNMLQVKIYNFLNQANRTTS